jgi:hypothetical protein
MENVAKIEFLPHFHDSERVSGAKEAILWRETVGFCADAPAGPLSSNIVML